MSAAADHAGKATLAGKVAIVTGASSGIGAATARELGLRGATVVLAARRVPELEAQAEAIRASGGEALPIRTDVADGADVMALAERALAAFGKVDVLVNNAGASWMRPLASSPPDGITDLVGVNLLGAMLLTRAVLPGMLARGSGAIISVGSLSGRVAMEPLYSATKYGLRGFSLALRRQLAGSGVTVSLVAPGNIATAMTGHIDAQLPEPGLVATAIADLVIPPAPGDRRAPQALHDRMAGTGATAPGRSRTPAAALVAGTEGRSRTMDILITGGTGLLGRHLVPALQERGETVRVLALPGENTRWLEAARRQGVPGRHPAAGDADRADERRGGGAALRRHDGSLASDGGSTTRST